MQFPLTTQGPVVVKPAELTKPGKVNIRPAAGMEGREGASEGVRERGSERARERGSEGARERPSDRALGCPIVMSHRVAGSTSI